MPSTAIYRDTTAPFVSLLTSFCHQFFHFLLTCSFTHHFFLFYSPLCTSITPSLFHSRLKTYLFHKSYPRSFTSSSWTASWTISSELLRFLFFLMFRFWAVRCKLAIPSAVESTLIYRIVSYIAAIRTLLCRANFYHHNLKRQQAHDVDLLFKWQRSAVMVF